MTKRILVTGGAGYIGSQACKALARAGHEPVAYDDLSRGYREAVRWGPLIEGDLADGALLSATLARIRPAAIMHFAAYTYVGESVARPELYFRNNVANSLMLFEAAIAAGAPPIIYSSTCATYGHPDIVPIDETAPQHPLSPYGESKLMTERQLHWLDRAHGLRYATLRYFNAAGADPEGETGEMHDPETHLIPLVLEAAVGGGKAIEIYGTDYPTPDGTAIRDYIHVQDLAEAHVRALGYLLDGGGSVALNLGTGRGYSVREVLAAAERVTGRDIPRREVARRPGDPPMLVADAGRATKLLDWRPSLSDLDTIIGTAWGWHRRHPRIPRH